MTVRGHQRTTCWRAVASLSAALAAAALVVGCGGGDSSVPGTSVVPATAGTAQAKPVAYSLYTHCGIDEARIGGRYYEAVTPLSDGSGNPPAGWGNPYQAGTVTAVSPSEMLFTDPAGHRVLFRLRPGATLFAHVCS